VTSMKNFKLFVLSLALTLLTSFAQAQNIKVQGHYNGRGWVPGYEYNSQTGWAKSTYTGGSFNYRPSSGYTSYPNHPTQNRGGYPGIQPRVGYNYGIPYIQPSFGNFKQLPPGGWYQNNW
jgi:hypothetical protein